MDTIGKRLRAARTARKLTQLEAADLVGVDNSHISKIERDADRPSFRLLLQFASAYGVRPIELVPPNDPLAEFASFDLLTDEREKAWIQIFRDKPRSAQDALLLAFHPPEPA